LLFIFFSWLAVIQNQRNKTEVQAIVKKTIVNPPIKDNTADAILAKKEVPVLCYHNIRDFTDTASGMIKTYTVKPAAFAEQMKAPSDAGYHTVYQISCVSICCTTLHYLKTSNDYFDDEGNNSALVQRNG
jgi:hypothetical protein